MPTSFVHNVFDALGYDHPRRLLIPAIRPPDNPRRDRRLPNQIAEDPGHGFCRPDTLCSRRSDRG